MEGVAPATPGFARGGRRSCDAWLRPWRASLLRRLATTDRPSNNGHRILDPKPGIAAYQAQKPKRPRGSAALRTHGGRRSCDAWLRPWRASLLRRLATTDRPSTNGHRSPDPKREIGAYQAQKPERPRGSAALRIPGGRRSCDAWRRPTGHQTTDIEALIRSARSVRIRHTSQSGRAGARPSVPVEGVAPATPGDDRQAINQRTSKP